MKKYSAVGIDVSDKNMKVIGLDTTGEITLRHTVACTREAIRKVFGRMEPTVIALETGGHTGWIARTLVELGHESVVANARKLKAIWDDDKKTDWRDAETLARLVRTDRKLLRPITLRSEQTQRDMSALKARDALVRCRSLLVCNVRSLVKNVGERIKKCSTEAFARRCREEASAKTGPLLAGILDALDALNEHIAWYDGYLEEVANARYSEATNRMRQIQGVGPITALTFVLGVEDPQRFKPRRQVGAYLGMTPRRDQSGTSDKQLGIPHAGNEMVRRLLVSAAHYIMGSFGPDTDLRRFGERRMKRGGKNAKKRAVVAVARKLSILMLRLWQTGETDESLKNNPVEKSVAA
jgi:transposase